ncbi:uncharacterized protein lcorl isoform X1 [Girardinichthys multiradiatus]|uniref:uncharacterized protein lcorl isoform X1 n=1 Tax=Girardinichthys multiradiatus TaxID=208333 RepID=UPI001FAB8B4D|nr:uncharacterized protein lcorl isoform X1 [Girardinichthys multiradiatus]
MAAVQCTKCMAERKGFRRELDSWRHRLIHYVGLESILEGIYGPILLRDLNLFVDCEPDEVDDWSAEGSLSQCSFCNLPLDKLNDQVPAAVSPLSSPSDYSPCQTSTISESSQSAHKFLHAVFHQKDATLDCDPKIPLVAQELMKKMIHQFAVEYASKCLLLTTTNGVTRPSSPLSETSDAPLDLTVNRTFEERQSESETDGVLDLSNRNSASSATSSIHNASGSWLPSVTEEGRVVGQRGTKFHQRSALNAVLRSLCREHRSLLYQILKLAHQEKLLSFQNHKPIGQTESHRCHCVNPQVDIEPHSVPLKECKAHNHKLYWPSGDCDHQSYCSAPYHLGDSESSCSLHHHPYKDCNSESQQGSGYCCGQRCRGQICPALCSKKVHCNSCQSHAADCTNILRSNALSPLLSESLLCTSSSRLCSSVCHKQHQSLSCSCYPTHICLTTIRTRAERGFGDRDSPCTVLNRDRSPSPPRLSPIPQDISKKMNEKPPSLSYHTQGEEADLIVKNSQGSACHITASVDAATDTEPQCKSVGHNQAEQNPEGSSLQDVVNRFTRKLETITSLDKDPTLVSTAVYVSEEESQFPSTSQPFHADAHLTEIITTVLHTGSASDYNLSELFNRHHNKEPKSPNTRSRRRQEIQVAIATPANDACARRNTLAIKRNFAMLDPSYNRRKGTQAKKVRLKKENMPVPTSVTSSDPDLFKEASNRKSEATVELVKNHGINEGTQCTISAESDRDKAKAEIKAMMVTDELQTVKEERAGGLCFGTGELPISNIKHASEMQNTCEKQVLKDDHVQTQPVSMSPSSVTKSPSLCTEGCGWSPEEATSVQNFDTDSSPDKGAHSPVNEEQKCKSHQSRGVRKSVRNIVPPQRLSSYITWPAPIFHALSVETDGTQAKLENKPPFYPLEHKGNLTFEPKPTEPSELMSTQSKGKCQVLQQTVAIDKDSSQMNDSERKMDINDVPSYGRLRSSTRRLQALRMLQNALNVSSSPTPKAQYVSPIKLMFVSPVKDQEGIKYSLKSAGSGSSLQTEEVFDPCVESSWSGTPQKHKSQSKEHAVSPTKTSPSPAKAVTSRTSSPAKSPKCQTLPRSATSSPKTSTRTSGDGTPSKRLSESENQRSPRELVSLCETTPPKRRPGRPRKLGPRLEQKVKRPIGRPRKQKHADVVTESQSLNGKCSTIEDVTKNLKITVLYGRSRRNKRVVSEGFDQLQTNFNNARQAVNLKSDLGFSLACSRRSSGIMKLCREELNFVSPANEPTPHSMSSIKTQRQNGNAPSRKPGRPAKIKISGISVTVTAASPRRRQIQIVKETRILPKTQPPKEALLPESAKEPCIGSSQLPIKNSQGEVIETKNRNKYELTNQTTALRHSIRERKPSIHLLHAVATSTFRYNKYSHALLCNERRQEEQQVSAETQPLKRQPCRRERENTSQDLNKVAKISLDSIFSPRKTVRWWAASAEENAMNQELARRIRVISETWVADAPNEQDKEVVHDSNLDTKGSSPVTRKSKKSSVVRALFDCSPNEPRSCSIQQICSWFMQTTETQSLAIVKKASSRNPFELMHFPRSANKKSVSHSPQAERLRKHVKKFAKTVPKSPLQHQQAQLRLRKKKKAHQIHRQFVSSLPVGKHNRGVMWWRFSLSAQFRATLFRVRRRFLTLRERQRWQKWKGKKKNKRITASSNKAMANHKALHRSAKHQLSNSLWKSSPTCSVDQTMKYVDVHKEQKLSSKAWSPEKLKECRVFLRKINSPDNKSAEEEGDSCTVTLDNGSPSTDLFEGKETDLEGVTKAVRNGRKRSLNNSAYSRKLSDLAPQSLPKGKERGRHKQSVVTFPEIPQPPPAKVLRQSRMRGLTGPRWCDFVFET